MTIAKTKSLKDGKRFLQDAFKLEQELPQVKLELSSQSVTHPGTLGEVNENYFIAAEAVYSVFEVPPFHAIGPIQR